MPITPKDVRKAKEVATKRIGALAKAKSSPVQITQDQAEDLESLLTSAANPSTYPWAPTVRRELQRLGVDRALRIAIVERVRGLREDLFAIGREQITRDHLVMGLEAFMRLDAFLSKAFVVQPRSKRSKWRWEVGS
jgi:hypothetical protein